jgi:hypothetical protein
MIQLPLFDRDKRWRSGRQHFVVPPDVFHPAGYHVEPIRTKDAKAFVLEHHYSSSFVATRWNFGLMRGRELLGVAAFSVPMAGAVISKYLGVSPDRGIELGRFTLDPEVKFNGESWFLSRAFRQLHQIAPQLAGVVSFADPMERRDPVTDAILKRAHFGTVYRSLNAEFAGRSGARWLHVLPNGEIANLRTLSKVRNEEQGRDYAERLLVTGGITPRAPHESGRAWLERIKPQFSFLKHPGNLAFTWRL